MQLRRPHRHHELEFNLVTAGRAAYLVEGRRYDLAPGTLIWLYPEQDHVLVNEEPDFGMWIAVFRPSLLERACTEPSNAELRRQRPTLPICRRLETGVSRALSVQCEQLQEQQTQTDLYNAGLGYLLLSTWAVFGSAADPGRATDIHPAVERSARLVRDESQPLSIDQIADHVGLTASHLSRLFHQQVGVSLTAYRQQCCLDRFVQRFGQGRRLNMTEAALAAGFGSYAQFHRVFKQHFGFGPAEYRRRAKAEHHA